MIAMLLLLASTTITVLGQIVGEQQIDYNEIDLNALSDDELEAICRTRGFELVKDEIDPNTNEVYKLTHEDFVEAATRCLAIEHEM
jgi:hypothetical protein